MYHFILPGKKELPGYHGKNRLPFIEVKSHIQNGKRNLRIILERLKTDEQ
jgi:hypothetical protein